MKCRKRIESRVSPRQLVALVCAAQVLVQLGAFFWPALLPGLLARWELTYGEAGWITAAFYAAYILAVPVLVTLTDRIDAKLVYLVGVAMTVAGHLLFGLLADGFWSAMAARALTGAGWAGTYMTGLKLLADRVEGKLMSRATAGHAASIGISGALSFACADVIASLGGWRAAFVAAAASAALAWLLVAWAVPRPVQSAPVPASDHRLFDFRPVLRNRSAMAYAIVYGVHTLEMNALRGWGVAFLAFVATSTHTSVTAFSPAAALTVLGLAGTLASVLGNEAAILLGRRRLISVALIASAVCAALLGFFGTSSYLLAVVLLVIYGPIVWLDFHPSRRARQVPPIRPGGAPPSRYTRCLVTSAASSARWPWVGSLMRAGACRPRHGLWRLSGSHCSRPSRWRYSCSCDRASSSAIRLKLLNIGSEMCGICTKRPMSAWLFRMIHVFG